MKYKREIAIVLILAIITIFNSQPINASKEEKFEINTDTLYSNVFETKYIVMSNISVVTKNDKEFKEIDSKKYLIRDIANEIIFKSDLEVLKGNKPLDGIKADIKDALEKEFQTNGLEIFFSDFIVQF